MITTVVSDFSRVLLFPKDEAYTGGLNALNNKLLLEFGETYKFLDYYKINEELLDVYKSLREKFPIYIFTSDAVQNHPEVRAVIDPIVTGIFSAKELNLKKTTPEAYTFIAQKIMQPIGQIVYVDDTIANLDAAKQAGMHVLHYENNVETKKVLNLLSLVE
jgi:HAD superfamily hydrolase (TIGR01509 family)